MTFSIHDEGDGVLEDLGEPDDLPREGGRQPGQGGIIGPNHRAAGAQLALSTALLSGRVAEHGVVLRTGGNGSAKLLAAMLVNAAGPWAPSVARSIQGIPAAAIPTAHFAKGHYAALRGRAHRPSPVALAPEPVVSPLPVKSCARWMGYFTRLRRVT